jgi:hypothetical protein
MAVFVFRRIMEKFFARLLLPGLLLLLAHAALAAPAPKVPKGLHSDGSLDREKIHALYLNGDFDEVREALEQYRKSRDSLDQSDKIFVYKYLGVIYSSDPKTRTKGEGYLFSLLQLVPTITLLDMYISDAVESIFDRVRERYAQIAVERRSEAESYKAPAGKPAAPATAPKASPAEKPGGRSWAWAYWAAGGAALASAVAVYYIASDSPTENEHYVLQRK